MGRSANMWRAVMLMALLAATLPVAQAQTNVPPAEPTVSDPDVFFSQYREATRLARENHPLEASIVLDTLAQKLSASPWLEIALLKHAELAELRSEQTALDAYQLLRQRLQNAPYFQGNAERAQMFRAAIGGAVANGINRIRARRVRNALQRYFVRYQEYPESLTKLAILGYIEIENIHAADDKQFRYVPTGQQLTPFISYKRYEGLETAPAEPLTVATPRVDATTLVNEQPPKYAALLIVPGRVDAMRVVENQTLQDYLIAAIAQGGAIVCNPQRVLVLLTPR